MSIRIDVKILGGGIDAPGDIGNRLRRQIIEYQDELIAAEAADRIMMPDRMGERLGETPQDIIAVLMPEGIIGLLEVVEIDDEQGVAAAFIRYFLQDCIARVFDGRFIEDAGQRIGLSHGPVIVAAGAGFLQFIDGCLQNLILGA